MPNRKHIAHPIIPTSDIFLTGVKYHDKVRFLPIAQISTTWREHILTNPLFIAAAKTNSLREWEALGIPPIEAFWHEGKYHHIVGQGQTRINSCFALHDRHVIHIPVWDVSESVLISSRPTTRGRPETTFYSEQYKSWNVSGQPLARRHPVEWDENEFCGFN
jgi:hypothetical protein